MQPVPLRTDNAVKNRHAVLVKKEEKKEEARSGGAGSAGSGGAGTKRKRAPTGDAATNTSSDSHRRGATRGGATANTPSSGAGGAAATQAATQTSAGTSAGGSGSWRPKLSVKIPGKNNGNHGGLASAGGSGGTSTSGGVGLGSVRGAPPSLEGLQTSASLTAAEIELLKQVQELISPNAAGFGLDPPQMSTRPTRSGTPRVPGYDAGPQTPLETPTVDLQQARVGTFHHVILQSKH
jgi:hypothetical protein